MRPYIGKKNIFSEKSLIIIDEVGGLKWLIYEPPILTSVWLPVVGCSKSALALKATSNTEVHLALNFNVATVYISRGGVLLVTPSISTSKICI